MKIKAMPEGREGVWLINKFDMARWLEELPYKQVHCYLPTMSTLIGADWKKAEVIGLILMSDRIAVLTGVFRKHNMNHSLSVIVKNKLYIFDIGEITDDDIEKENQT